MQQRQPAPRQSGRPLPYAPADMQNYHLGNFNHGYQPEPFLAPTATPAFPSPQLPPNYQFQSGLGIHSPPTQQFAPLPPAGNYRVRPPVRIDSIKPSSAEKSAVRGKPVGQAPPSTLLPHHSLPPSGSQRTSWNRSRASSHDSTSPERDQYGPPLPQRILRQKSAPSEFPPPPPTSAPPNPHVRTGSTGSVSSLESSNSAANFEKDDGDAATRSNKHLHRRSSLDEVSGAATFLQMFNPWSPKPQAGPQHMNDFHRTNQDFLRRSELDRNAVKNIISPLQQQPQRRYVASSLIWDEDRRVQSADQICCDRGGPDRPPSSRGAHKRLSSIENDNWDEEQKIRSERTASGSHTYFTSDGKAHTFVGQPARMLSSRQGEASSSSPYSRFVAF